LKHPVVTGKWRFIYPTLTPENRRKRIEWFFARDGEKRSGGQVHRGIALSFGDKTVDDEVGAVNLASRRFTPEIHAC
jgi:hypothetical protein